jgi:hypothetical protein
MNARLLSTNGPALLGRASQSHLSAMQHTAANNYAMRHDYAIWYDLQPNRTTARVSWRLLPTTPENVTGNISREHVKHKYKRPGCRV